MEETTNLLALKPMNATGVANFLKNEVRPFVSVREKREKQYLYKALTELKQMAQESEKKENKAYKMLGVSSLEGLQRKLDELNNNGLNKLTNRALQKFPAIQTSKDQTFIDSKKIYRDIEKDFLSWVSSELKKEKLDDEDYFKMIVPYFKKIGIKLDKNKDYALRRGTKKILGLDFHSFTQAELKRIRKKYRANIKMSDQIQDLDINDNTGTYELTIELPNGEIQLNYYPYFKLSPEQKTEALKNKELWNSFKKAVGQCVDGPLSFEVEWVMQNVMGCKAFIEAGGSYSDIVGIFGELHSLVLLHHLNITKTTPLFLGHTKVNGQKIGIDAALGEIGFQVKNYNTYGTRGKNEGINLRGEYKLRNFLDIITSNTSLSGLEGILEKFYAVSAYHIAVNSDFYNIRNWMNHIQIDQLPQMYHSVIGNLLPIKQISWIETETKRQQFSTNAFYIIGGTRILPVSKILNLYIQFLEKLRQGIESPKLVTMGANGGITYSSSETYKKYYDNPTSYIFPGYKEISNNITIRYRINLNIDYTIEGVLSKLKREGVQF